MNTQALYSELKQIAPLVVFSASREADEYHYWDGDGPDPVTEGFMPYVVTAHAKAIHNGMLMSAEDSLCGCYYGHKEPIADVHGYLPQMLDQAATELAAMLPTEHPAQAQLKLAIAHIEGVMRAEYEAQRAELAKL